MRVCAAVSSGSPVVQIMLTPELVLRSVGKKMCTNQFALKMVKFIQTAAAILYEWSKICSTPDI